MRTINSSRRHPATTDRATGPSVRSDAVPIRRPRPRHIADAVTAGYIHDISQASRRDSVRGEREQLIAQPV
jgi:hypothetical protein